MDYYQILGIQRNATEAEIKRAYRRLALQYHPDRNPGDESATRKFKEIQAAYEVLMDLNRRSQYNAKQPSQKAPVKQKPRARGDMYIADAPPPPFDIWGRPLSASQKAEWVRNNTTPIERMYKHQEVFREREVVQKKKSPSYTSNGFLDSFGNDYERSEGQPDIR